MRPLFFLPDPQSRSYCWVIVFAGFLGLFAALGLGRFSLGMLLPSMGLGLDLDYGQMGFISTANFCGYLCAVILCGWLSNMLGARLLIFLALLAAGASMLLVSISSSHPVIVALYFLTGMGSGFANVPIMALIAAWFPAARRGRAAGLCIMGNGLGILLSARLIHHLLSQGGSWRSGWSVLGGVVLVIAFICYILFRNSPSHSPSIKSVTGQGSRPSILAGLAGRQKRSLLLAGGIYLFFGLSYVIYITFMVTSLVQDRGLSEQEAGGIWGWVGILSIGSGPLFGTLSDRYGRKPILMLVFAMQALAYILIASQLPIGATYLSAVLYGLVAFSVPTIIAALVGDCAGPQLATTVFGWVTFVFGIGQIAGPALAGQLALYSGGFSSSFLLAACFACCGLLLCALLPSSDTRRKEREQ